MSHALVRCNYRCNGGFQHQPFRPLFLFVSPAFYRRQPWSKWSTCYDTFHTLEEKNTQEMWCKKKKPGLKTLEQELEFFLWTILLLSLLLLLFHEKDIENVYLFLNIVSLSLSYAWCNFARGPISPLPRVYNGYSFMDHVGKLFASKHKFLRALRIRRWSISITYYRPWLW